VVARAIPHEHYVIVAVHAAAGALPSYGTSGWQSERRPDARASACAEQLPA